MIHMGGGLPRTILCQDVKMFRETINANANTKNINVIAAKFLNDPQQTLTMSRMPSIIDQSRVIVSKKINNKLTLTSMVSSLPSKPTATPAPALVPFSAASLVSVTPCCVITHTLGRVRIATTAWNSPITVATTWAASKCLTS